MMRMLAICLTLIGRSHTNPATTQMDTDMWTFRQSLYKQIKQLSQVSLFSFPWPLPSPPTQETNYWCSWFWPATPGQESTQCESRDRTHKSYLYLICGALAWQLEHTLNLWKAKVMKWFTCSLRWDLFPYMDIFGDAWRIKNLKEMINVFQ